MACDGCRGLMTWSVNWDRYCNWEFRNGHASYLGPLPRTGSARAPPPRAEPAPVDYRCLFVGPRWYEGRMTASTTRAVILTVDDDPGVSRSIARDLRRRYGEANRIVRAESPAQALDALKELKLRGEPVALLLADYRMPQMSGIEFLEAAMDLFPL